MNRSIQSEGAFGVVKQNYGFQRFLLRGNKKVSTEILLVAMAYNVNKLHSKIRLFMQTICPCKKDGFFI